MKEQELELDAFMRPGSGCLRVSVWAVLNCRGATDSIQRGGRTRHRERRPHERHPPAAGAQVRRTLRPLPQLQAPRVQ